jgi:acyl-CoA synthetase (AMP-forming)/AMP-acid ligase II
MRTTGEIIKRNARNFPDREAYVCGGRRLSHAQCPKSVDFVSELPRLPTGKLDKPGLRAGYRP